MTLSTSDKRLLLRDVCRYWLTALACAGAGAVYETLSHGVFSPFMALLFLPPLACGVPALLLALTGRGPMPSAGARRAWALGCATLTAGSALRGVFDIYGTRVPLTAAYWAAGGILLAGAAASLLRAHRAAPHSRR